MQQVQAFGRSLPVPATQMPLGPEGEVHPALQPYGGPLDPVFRYRLSLVTPSSSPWLLLRLLTVELSAVSYLLGRTIVARGAMILASQMKRRVIDGFGVHCSTPSPKAPFPP